LVVWFMRGREVPGTKGTYRTVQKIVTNPLVHYLLYSILCTILYCIGLVTADPITIFTVV
jgi:hypothetical protein